MSTVDIEIGLHRSETDDYIAELRYRRSDSAVDVAPLRGKAGIDFDELSELITDAQSAAAYGKELFKQLFACAELLTYFDKARVQAGDDALRIRLFIG